MPVSGYKYHLSERSLANVPEVSGVYSLLESGVVVYIGESGQLRTRLLAHLAGRATPGTDSADQYKYERVAGAKTRKARQDALLVEYRAKHRRLPRCNTQPPS